MDAALARAARFGDGWLGTWCSPKRFREALGIIDALSPTLPRRSPSRPWLHGLQLWVGIDADKRVARERLAAAMESFYRIPYERFEKYSPFGTAEDVARFLLPYRDAGCRLINITAIAQSEEAAIDAVRGPKRQRIAEHPIAYCGKRNFGHSHPALTRECLAGSALATQ